MAEQAVPTYDAMMQPVLEVLRAAGGQASNEQICAAVIDALDLPLSVSELPHKPGSSLTELQYRLQWTRTYLRQFGLIDSPRRSVWVLTEAGRQTEQVDPREVVRFVRGQMGARKAEENGQEPIFAQDGGAAEAGTPDAAPALRSPTPLFPTYSNVRRFLTHPGRHNERGIPGDGQRNLGAARQSAGAGRLEQSGRMDRRAAGGRQPRAGAAHLAGIAARAQPAPHARLLVLCRPSTTCWRATAATSCTSPSAAGPSATSRRARWWRRSTRTKGVPVILQLVAAQGTARRSTLLPGYGEYSRSNTTFQSDNVLKSSLYDRLRNLIDRGMVIARGNSYVIAEAGLQYLERFTGLTPEQPKAASRSAELFRLASSLSEEARQQLHDYLLEMNAFKFEELVKLLLEEMGYDNVATTSPTNDKGVDVVGTIKLGISAVREVIQVKRHRGTIHRPVLDQLRGSLHRFNAVRGTIITTGRFSKGVEEAAFERGAAPITLIDGEKLLDLLIEQRDRREQAPAGVPGVCAGEAGAV